MDQNKEDFVDLEALATEIQPKTVASPQIGEILRNKLKGSTSIFPPKPSIRTITDAVDLNDLGYRTNDYISLIYREMEQQASELSHRALMMRQRAEEFDQMADNIRKSMDTVAHGAKNLAKTHQQVQDLIDEHRHIEPQKVTNGNTSG